MLPGPALLRKFAAPAGVMLLLACGGGERAPTDPGSNPSNNPPPAVTIAISPTTVALIGGASTPISATVANGSTSDVTWTSSGGVLSGTGSSRTFTAPMTGGPFTVTATSVADVTKSASATVTITPVGVTIAPATATVPAGGTQEFTATVANSSNNDVTWRISGGKLVANGNTAVLTVPVTTDPVTVTATSVADTSRSSAATITIMASTVVLNAAPVPTGGGVLKVTDDKSPLRGLTIGVPAGAYPVQTAWTVTALHTAQPKLPPNTRLVGPVLRIGNGQAYAALPFTISIPARIGKDSILGAFYLDQATGEYEELPLVGRTDSSIVVLTRHVDRRQLVAGSTPAALRWSRIMMSESEPVDVALLGANILTTNVSRFSDFRPASDDWEFANRGSYLQPKGYSLGASVSALYHFFFRRQSQGSLYQRYDRIPDFQHDNPKGLRLASVIQYDFTKSSTLWDRIGFVMDSARQVGENWVENQARAIAFSILTTGRPKLVSVHPKTTKDRGQLIIVFGFEGPEFSLSSTMEPGVPWRVRFSQGRFEPFEFASSADEPKEPYEQMVLYGLSALIPLKQIESYWTAFDDGTIGDELFPSVVREWMDPVNGEWRPMNGPVKTASESLFVRTLCPSCAIRRPSPSNAQRIITAAYDMTGMPVNDDRANDVEGTRLKMPTVKTYSGGLLHTWTHPSEPNVAHTIDFTFQDTKRVTFAMEKSRFTAIPGQEITFGINNPELPGGAGWSYVWTVGNSTYLVPFSSPNITHRFEQTGFFTQTVELKDPGGIVRARTRATQGVQEGYHWRMVCAQSTTSNPSPSFTSAQATAYQRWSTNVSAVVAVATDGFMSLLTPNTSRQFGSFFTVAKPNQGANAKALPLFGTDTLDSPKLALRYYSGTAFESTGGPPGFSKSYDVLGKDNFVGAQWVTSLYMSVNAQGWARGTLTGWVDGTSPRITLRFYARQIWEANPASAPPCAFGNDW